MKDREVMIISNLIFKAVKRKSTKRNCPERDGRGVSHWQGFFGSASLSRAAELKYALPYNCVKVGELERRNRSIRVEPRNLSSLDGGSAFLFLL